jgi:DNA repair protein RadC
MATIYSNRKPASLLSDCELLACFLRSGKRGSAQERATAILLEKGSLSAAIGHDLVCEAASDYFTQSEAKMIDAGREIGRRIAYEHTLHGEVLSSPEHVRQFLSLHLTGLGHEVFSGLFLDNRHRVIEYRELFTGTIDSAAVYPREIVKRCLSTNAAAVIFAHNHPSGVAEPSDTDVRLTRKLVDALALIDVRVLDHLVIGQGVTTSLAERGLM